MQVADWGRRSYRQSWDDQLQVLGAVQSGTQPDTLIFVEHDPVLTLGASFHPENLLLSPEAYAERGIAIEKTDRGGDVTYHGPGQLTIYPIFDLQNHGRDLHRWMRDLEQTMMLVAIQFALTPRRFAPHTGVWIGDRKLAAIGVKIKRWVSLHGIALNVNNPLHEFDLIVPCGIQGYGVTSLAEELGREVSLEEAKAATLTAFQSVFG
ncbi:MAG: lipoyl(octanoyl) transferase LipB [Chthonomonas sp.]|nr:lipoyl(octanoyl) transferase LipB [Chthonomonas sp.]